MAAIGSTRTSKGKTWWNQAESVLFLTRLGISRKQIKRCKHCSPSMCVVLFLETCSDNTPLIWQRVFFLRDQFELVVHVQCILFHIMPRHFPHMSSPGRNGAELYSGVGPWCGATLTVPWPCQGWLTKSHCTKWHKDSKRGTGRVYPMPERIQLHMWIVRYCLIYN